LNNTEMSKVSLNWKDEVGKRYTRLMVLSRAVSGKRGAHFHCLCDCGNLTVKSGSALRRGKVKSCGCLYIETRHRRMPKETKQKISKARKGIKFNAKHLQNLSISHMGQKVTEETKRKLSAVHQGITIDLWKEFATTRNHRRKVSKEWKKWRDAVFLRDDWTCMDCNERGLRLHPHHINAKSLYPELIFDVDNGITLCVECHMKTESWGRPSDREGMVARQEMVGQVST